MKSFEVEINRTDKIPVKDAKGNPVKDEKGNPVMKEEIKTIKVPIKALKIEKGKGAGGEYYVPDNISSFDLKWLLSLFSEEELMAKLIRPKLKQFCATVTAEAAYDGGKRTKAEAEEEKVPISPIQDEDAFIISYQRMFSELSPRGESVAGLTRAQNEIMAEIGQLDDSAEGVELKVRALFQQIKRIRESLAKKKKSDKSVEEEQEEDKQAVAA